MVALRCRFEETRYSQQRSQEPREPHLSKDGGRTDGTGHVRACRRLRSSFRRPNHQGTNAGDDHEPRLSSAATPPSRWVHARDTEGQVPDSSQTPDGQKCGWQQAVRVDTRRSSAKRPHILAFLCCCAEGPVLRAAGHLRPCHCEKRLHLCSRRAGSGNQGTNIETAACLTEKMDSRRQPRAGVQQRYLLSR